MRNKTTTDTRAHETRTHAPITPMKNGWDVKKLGEVCVVIAGQSPEGIFYNNDGQGLPFYQGKKDFTEKFIGEPTTWTTKITKEASEGDILMSVRAPVGPVNFCTQKICIGRGLAAIRPLKVIDKEYLYNYLVKHESEIIGNAGAVFASINKSQIENVPIPLPPLAEQKRIVAILDEAFAAIAKARENAEKNLTNAREVFESYLNGVFSKPGEGWEEKRLEEIAEHSLGKMLDKNKNKGTPKKYIRNQNVRWFEFDLSDLFEMRFLEDEVEKYTALKGDVLICEGGYPGRAAIWKEDYPIHFQKAIHRVRFADTRNNELFLNFLYLSDKNGTLKTYFSGTGIQHFTGEALGRFKIPLPPAKEVNSIIAKLNAISIETKRLEAIYRNKLAALDELKKSILDKAFKGELTRDKNP